MLRSNSYRGDRMDYHARLTIYRREELAETVIQGRLIVLWKVVTQALKGRTNGEYRQPTRLTDHFALIADAALAFVCESLHACENRIGVEMRFRDHFQFEATASPGIVEVGCE